MARKRGKLRKGRRGDRREPRRKKSGPKDLIRDLRRCAELAKRYDLWVKGR